MPVFFKSTHVYKSYVAGSRDDDTGKWIPGTDTETSFTANIQELNGDQLQFLPEGRRDSDTIKVFSNIKLKNFVDGSNPDVVLYDDKEFEVYQSKKYGTLIKHYESIAQKIEVVEEAEA